MAQSVSRVILKNSVVNTKRDHGLHYTRLNIMAHPRVVNGESTYKYET
jgi:hypothetical protein